MPKLFIKAKDLEEYDTVKVFNERGKEVYYTKDDFIATGHRIKVFLADTITECAYVQEKYDRLDNVRFEFAARDKFGTISRDRLSRMQKYIIDFDEGWEIAGDAVGWNYRAVRGPLDILKVKNEPYLIQGQALNLTDTIIIDVVVESDMLLALVFVLAVYALNKYSV